jgi:hypothetical protein
MTQKSFNEMADETALLPWLVAETVMLARNVNINVHSAFVENCDLRTLSLYNNNPSFKRNLLSAKRRNFLYAFVNHWLDSYLKDSEHYLAKHKYEEAK